MAGTVVLVGNNVAVMVAALELASRDRSVALVNPGHNWGGHFSYIELDGLRFDPGMVLYEFDSFNIESQPQLASYDPERRNDCGRFFGLVREYVERRMAMVPTRSPDMFFRGRVQPDLIIGNRLEALRLMDAGVRHKINAQLAAICARQDKRFHPSRKADEPCFADIDFATVSVANHGETLHESLLEPLCRKILGVAAGDILGIYHRAAWLPLYYPETLLSQFGPAPQRLRATTFHYPSGGSAGSLTAHLAAEILAQPLIRVVRSAVTAISSSSPSVLRCDDGTMLASEEIVWGLDPGALIGLAEPGARPAPFARASIGLCFIAVAAEAVKCECSTLFVVDPEYATYRVTNQDVCAGSGAPIHRIVAEFSPHELERRGMLEPAAQCDAIVRELIGMGLIDSPEGVAYCTVKSMKNVLIIPNAANRDLYKGQKSWMREHLPDLIPVAPAAGFFAGSLNDQIVQGLKIGMELGEGSK